VSVDPACLPNEAGGKRMRELINNKNNSNDEEIIIWRLQFYRVVLKTREDIHIAGRNMSRQRHRKLDIIQAMDVLGKSRR
jgi:hypothetical protein